jgi:hypothetical protein
MCTGIEIALIAGTAVSAAGSIMSGQAQQSEADKLAAGATLQARQRARSIRYMARQTLGTARADYAASGVDVNSGSPVVAERTINFNSEVDALNALASGNAEAASLKRSGRAANDAGWIKAGTSVLGAFASAGGYGGVSAGG